MKRGNIYRVFFCVLVFLFVFFLSTYVRPYERRVDHKSLLDASITSNASKSVDKDMYGDHFEIQYFWGPDAANIVSQGANSVKKIANAGFTIAPIIGSYTSQWEYTNISGAVNLLNQYNLKTFVKLGTYDDMMTSESLRNLDVYNSYVKPNTNYSNVIGFDVIDEPSLNKMNNGLIATVNYLKMVDIMRNSYVNLFPNYASKACLQNTSLGCDGASTEVDLDYYTNNYLNYFYNNTDIKYISVDNYLNLKDSSKFSNNKNMLFSNLRDVLNVYKNKKNNKVNTIPMNVVALHDWFIDVNNKNHIIYQVNVDLAFGMKSISYFTYEYPKEASWNGYLVDTSGNTTTQYNYVKDINNWLFNVGNELFDKEVLGIYLVNGSSKSRFWPSSKDANDRIDDLGDIGVHYSSVSANNYENHLNITSSNGSALVSYYDDGSYMIVNTDISKPEVVTISGLHLGSMEYFDYINNKWVAISISDAQLNDDNYVIKKNMFSLHPNRNSIVLDSGNSILLRVKQTINSSNMTTNIDRVNHVIITYSNSLYDTISSLDSDSMSLKVNGNDVDVSSSNDIKLVSNTKLSEVSNTYDVHGVISDTYKVTPSYVYTNFNPFSVNNLSVTDSNYISVSSCCDNNFIKVSYLKNGKQLKTIPIITSSFSSNYKVYGDTIYTNGSDFDINTISVTNGIVENNNGKVQIYTWPKKILVKEYSVVEESQNYLKAIDSSVGSLSSSFSKTVYDYTIQVGNDVTSISLVGTPEVASSVVKNASSNNLVVGDNPLSIEVTDKAGFTRKYTVNVVRASSNNNNSSDATLKSLSISGYSLSPSFDSSVTSYTVNVPGSVDSVVVNATVNDNGATIVSGTGTASLSSFKTTITVIVKASDETVKTYTIVVNKLSDNNYLSSLSISGYSLNPVFDKQSLSYSIEVPSNVNSVVVDAKLEDDRATIVSGVGTINLNAIVTNVTVKVKSEYGSEKNYVIVVKKLSNDTSLKFLKVNGITLTPGENGIYSLNVSDSTSHIKIEAESVSGKDVTFSDNNVSIEPNETKSFEIKVIAEDSSVTKTYILNVHRQASNTGIKEIFVNDVLATLSSDGSYVVSVPYSVSVVNIVVTKSYEEQVITIENNGASLEAGVTKEFKVIVGGENDSSKQEYILKVTRKEESTNNYLSSIAVKTSDNVYFPNSSLEKEVFDYEIVVPSNLSSVQLVLTTEDSTSILDYPSVVSLENDSTDVDVVVTSENGTKNTYKIKLVKDHSMNQETSSDLSNNVVDTNINNNNNNNNDNAVSNDKEEEIVNPKTGVFGVCCIIVTVALVSLYVSLSLYKRSNI